MIADNKIMVSVAPVDASSGRAVPEEIAEDVLRCAALGAAMVHLHVREIDGTLTKDTRLLEKTIDLIRKESDIIIEASTGGVSSLSIEERCAPLYSAKVEACSLNVGSVNLGKAVYLNPIDDVRYCVSEIKRTGKKPEVEVFEIGMIHTMKELQKEFALPSPLLFAIVLGHEGAAPATTEALLAMRSLIPQDAIWGITHAHREDNRIIHAALSLGARAVRVGFEDSYYIKKGKTAKKNHEIIANLVREMDSLGYEPMTASEARSFLGMREL